MSKRPWEGTGQDAAVFPTGQIFSWVLRLVVSTVALLLLFTVLAGCAGSSDDATYSLHLAWEPPDTNADGSPLEDLSGFMIYDGPSSGEYTMVMDVGNATDAVLEPLDAGTYYISVTAYDMYGNESQFSEEIVVTVP